MDTKPAAAPPAAKSQTNELFSGGAGVGLEGPLSNMDTIFPGLDDVIAVAQSTIDDNSIRGNHLNSAQAAGPAFAEEKRTQSESLPAPVPLEAETEAKPKTPEVRSDMELV
jgi:hypothetical protein